MPAWESVIERNNREPWDKLRLRLIPKYFQQDIQTAAKPFLPPFCYFKPGLESAPQQPANIAGRTEAEFVAILVAGRSELGPGAGCGLPDEASNHKGA